MTTFEKTWQFGINYLMDTSSTTNCNKNGWWWQSASILGLLPKRTSIKANSGDGKSHAEVAGTTQDLLTQGLWWCIASSDGSTAGTTTIASGSNNVTLPQSTINVTSTTGFASSGILYIYTNSGWNVVSYAATSGGTQFTGCSGGTGTLSTGNWVTDGSNRLNGAGGLGTTTLNTGGNAGSTNSGSAASFTTGATIPGAVRMSGLANMSASDVGNFLTITNADPANTSPPNTPFKIVNFVSSTSVDIYNPFGVTTDSHNGSVAWTERNPFNLPGSSSGNYSTIVNNNTGSAHSWIVLMSPTALGPFYYTLDYNSSSVTIASFSISKNVQSPTTTGSTTTAPAWPDTTTFSSFTWNANQSTMAGHLSLSTDGYFIQFNSRANGSGYCDWCSIFQLVGNPKSVDTYQFVYYNRWNSGTDALNSFYNVGSWMTRTYNGGASLTPVMLFPSYNNGAAILSVNNSSGDIATVDYSDGLFDDFPIYVGLNTSGFNGIKGRLVDIKQGPLLANGFCEPNPASPSSILIAGTWFPCNLQYLL